jgi:hypothetical protein
MHIFVKYIHTLINGNLQGAMLAIQNIVLGQLALQIYSRWRDKMAVQIIQTILELLVGNKHEDAVIITLLTI